MSQNFVTRFAPSPTGFLHLGHAYSAWLGYGLAQAHGGRFLLRIEDTDLTRTRSEYITAIYEDLTWLGIGWEQPVMIQSTRFTNYQQALAQLQDMGLVYPCWASRAEIVHAIGDMADASRDPDGAWLYPGIYRDIDDATRARWMQSKPPPAWRLDMAQAMATAKAISDKTTWQFSAWGMDGQTTQIPLAPESYGDIIIARKDTPTSYHLSVVIDDAAQDITHIVRGQDLYHATHIHRLLQILLDLPAPYYHHHALICDKQGRRLAKRNGDMGLHRLRANGYTCDDIKAMLPDIEAQIAYVKSSQ